MHTVELIAGSLTEDEAPSPDAEREDTCAVTGMEKPCVFRKLLLKKGFTNEAILKAPLSRWVSVDAYRVLRYRPERTWSWICNGMRFTKLNRVAVRDIVIGQKYPTVWAGYVTTSHKKHGSLWARVNTGNSRVWRFESLDVDCQNHSVLTRVWERLNVELRAGIGRTSLETLICSPMAIRAIGYRRWIDFERWARPIMASPLYRFLVYLLPSRAELDIEQKKKQRTGVEDSLEDVDFFEAIEGF